MRRFLVPGLALALVVAFPALGSAQTDQFLVSINVQADCIIQVDDLNLGAVTDLMAPVTAVTQGMVTCNSEIPVEVSFDVGSAGGSYNSRWLDSGLGYTVSYNLYRDMGHTEILGDGSGGTVTISLITLGGQEAFTILRRPIPDSFSLCPGPTPRL